MTLLTLNGWKCRQQMVSLLPLLLCAHPVWAEDINTVFEDAKAFGQVQQARAVNSISTQSAQENIPNYTTGAKESSLFDQGRGALFSSGKGKITNCATGPKADSPYHQQECDVVNFLAKNPQQRPKIVIDKNDPLITGATQMIDAAKNNGTFSGCVNTIEAQPDIAQEATCTESNRTDVLSCEKILLIKQNPGCSPGQYLGRVLKNICPKCLDPYVVADVYCSGTNQGYTISVWTSRTADGNTPYTKMFTHRPVPGNVGLSQANTLIGDFGQKCHFPLYYNQTCNAATCTMQLSLIGSTCNGKNFTASGNYQIPFTYSDSWDDRCVSLDARTR